MKQLVANRNELLQGPAPACLGVLRRFPSAHVAQYLEGYGTSLLVPRLARDFQLSLEQVLVGYGIEDLLRSIFDYVASRHGSVLTSALHYSYYGLYLRARRVPIYHFRMLRGARAFSFDSADCVRQFRRHRPALIVIASPNNPTGNTLTIAQLTEVLREVSRRTLVVIDEAYQGFADHYDQAAFLGLLRRYPNLILLRTFSKFYGLAGLRIAYALCGVGVRKQLGYQNRYLGLSRVLEEVALAALDSPTYYHRLAAGIRQQRHEFMLQVASLQQVQAFKSQANFVLLRFRSAKVVTRVTRLLKQQPTVIAKFVRPGLLRVSLSLPQNTRRFVNSLSVLSRKG